MTKRSVEALILCGFMVLAVLLYYSTASYPASVQGSTANYVRFLGLALGVFVAAELLLWIKRRRAEEAEMLILAEAPVPFWGLFALLCVYCASITYLGFYASSGLFLPAGMYLLGERNVWKIGLTSGGILLFIYVVFAKLLEVPLPQASLF